MTKIGTLSPTVTESSGLAINVFYNNSFSGIFGYYHAAPSTPYRVAILLQGYVTDNSASSGICAGWIDSTGKLQYIEITANNYARAYENSAYNGSPSVYSENAPIAFVGRDIWFGIHDDGSHCYVEYSIDGVNFVKMGTDNHTGGYLADRNNIFWGFLNNGYDCSLTLRCWDVNGLSRTFPNSA
jgi:hypothetical protein